MDQEQANQLTRAIDRNTRALLRIADMMADHIYPGGATAELREHDQAHNGINEELRRVEDDE